MTLSAVAVAVSLLVDATTDVSQTALVLAVIVVGFVASLVTTERAARATTVNRAMVHSGHGHRVTVLPTPHRVA